MPAIRNLDLAALRTFVAIAEAGSFTAGGQRVYRNQSTVSLQIRRLEDALGARLFDRTTRRLALTPQGEATLVQARQLLALNDQLIASVAEPDLHGVVRLGAPEDFATTHLPAALSRFAHAFPAVELEVVCDLTLHLISRFDAGGLDFALIKREPGAGAALGQKVWREALVWVGAHREVPRRPGALALVLAPPPCVYRKRAAAALDGAGLAWRQAYACASLAGVHAAVRAGLGITVLPRGMAPPDMVTLDEADGLPPLPDTEIALLTRPTLTAPAQRLAAHIVRTLEHAGPGWAAGPPAEGT